MELTQRRLLLEKERSMCRRDCRFEMLHVEKGAFVACAGFTYRSLAGKISKNSTLKTRLSPLGWGAGAKVQFGVDNICDWGCFRDQIWKYSEGQKWIEESGFWRPFSATIQDAAFLCAVSGFQIIQIKSNLKDPIPKSKEKSRKSRFQGKIWFGTYLFYFLNHFLESDP